MLHFEWDERKSAANKKKYGVSFEEAQSVFFDESAIEYDDPEHFDDKDRFILVGKSYLLRVLVVCHCFRRSASVIRIISARKATRRERRERGER
jgi:uncharacterized DUF497 family protein